MSGHVGMRWPFPADLAHTDEWPCYCADCRGSAGRVGDFDGRPAPIHGPDIEVGQEHDLHGVNPAEYRRGWLRADGIGDASRERLR